MNLWTAMVAIAGIIGIVQITRYRMESRRQADIEDGSEADERFRRLEERVRTLERIVTDRRDSLERSFEELE